LQYGIPARLRSSFAVQQSKQIKVSGSILGVELDGFSQKILPLLKTAASATARLGSSDELFGFKLLCEHCGGFLHVSVVRGRTVQPALHINGL